MIPRRGVRSEDELESVVDAVPIRIAIGVRSEPVVVGPGEESIRAFPQADIVMDRTFFVGTSPVVSAEMAHYIGKSVREAVVQFAKK